MSDANPQFQQLPQGMQQEAPPRPLVPALPDIGIGEMRPYMTDNAYHTLTGLVTWAVHLQNLVEEKDMEWGDDKVNIAIAPFVGFGLPEMWEGVYKPKLYEGLMSLLMRWHRKGKRWQKANPLPWLILEYKACDFAQSTKGYSNALAIEQILSEPDFIKKWKGDR